MPGPNPIWAPWRMDYIVGEKSDKCIFCEYATSEKVIEPVLFQTKHSYAVMNTFPYNVGHFLVVPKRHVENIEDLNGEEYADLSELIRNGVKVLKSTLKADGLNIGLNLGDAAGAGITGHLHYHIVPRWKGDTNFMPVIGETKVISEHLTKTYEKLKPAFL